MQRICSKQRLDQEDQVSHKTAYPIDGASVASLKKQICRTLEDSDAELNLQPSAWFFAAICTFSACATAFLEAYVLTASGHLAVFLVGGYVVFSSYFVCDYVMSRVSSSYAAIPREKKFYVLSNLVKAAVLLSYTPVAARTLYLAMARDQWRTTSIRNLGVLYAIPDTVSMLLVERMALTTKLHHICVFIFMVVNLFNDYEKRNVWRALVVYAVFSTFAYLVNLLLASRFLSVSRRLSTLLSAAALTIYSSCLGANWAWQIKFLSSLWAETHEMGIWIYLAFVSLVVWDDIVLVKWLFTNVKGGGQQRSKKKTGSSMASKPDK